MTLSNTRVQIWGRVFWLFAVAILCALLGGSCQKTMNETSSSTPPRDINTVLADHVDKWMAMPGVVGVYVGLKQKGVNGNNNVK